MKQMGDWVLCHIFSKNDDATAGSLCYDQSSYSTSSTSCCIGSTVITDQQGSSYGSDHEETSTTYNM